MAEQKKMKWDPIYDLNRDMLQLIYEACPPKAAVKEFAEKINGLDKDQINNVAKEVFGKYGAGLMEKTWELGDDPKYMDQGYKVLREWAARPENGPFPYIIQRFIEVAYIAFNSTLVELGVLEVTTQAVEYWLDCEECDVYLAETEMLSPEVMETLPCRHVCLSAAETLLEKTGVEDAEIIMVAEAPKDELCRFIIKRPVEIPTLPILHWE